MKRKIFRDYDAGMHGRLGVKCNYCDVSLHCSVSRGTGGQLETTPSQGHHHHRGCCDLLQDLREETDAHGTQRVGATTTTRQPRRRAESGDDRPATVVRRNTDATNEINQHGLDLQDAGLTTAADAR